MSALKCSLPSAKNGGGIYREYEVSPTANDFSSARSSTTRKLRASIRFAEIKGFSLPKNGPEPDLPGSDLLRDVEEKLKERKRLLDLSNDAIIVRDVA